MKVESIPIDKLTEYKKASELIPEMSGEEWADFIKSIEKDGVKVPIHVNQDYEVLDGRHRLKAARELGIDALEAIQHNFTADQAIEFVRDTAIQRRNLTPEQKLDIIFNTEEMIKSLYEKGRKKQVSKLKHQDSSFSSVEENDERTHNTHDEIAKMAGTSKTQVWRAKKIKQEEPEIWDEVVDGKKSIWKAYTGLESVKEQQANKKTEKGGDEDVEEIKRKSGRPPKQRNQQPPQLSKEEFDRQMLDANVATVFRHLEELAGFIERTENVEEVLEKAIQVDSRKFYGLVDILERTLKLIKSEVA